MLPDPLHPALVHFPIVLAVLLPAIAGATLWAIRRGARPAKAWSLTVATAAALAASGWAAMETGEREEERVERVVAHGPLHRHEEAGERFLLLSAGLAAVAAAGLLGGRTGRLARLAATLGAVALLALGVQVGHSGGTLVYREGAANAYGTGAGATASSEAAMEVTGDD